MRMTGLHAADDFVRARRCSSLPETLRAWHRRRCSRVKERKPLIQKVSCSGSSRVLSPLSIRHPFLRQWIHCKLPDEEEEEMLPCGFVWESQLSACQVCVGDAYSKSDVCRDQKVATRNRIQAVGESARRKMSNEQRPPSGGVGRREKRSQISKR